MGGGPQGPPPSFYYPQNRFAPKARRGFAGAPALVLLLRGCAALLRQSRGAAQDPPLTNA
jgi:hypothetical protein